VAVGAVDVDVVVGAAVGAAVVEDGAELALDEDVDWTAVLFEEL